MTLGTWYKIGSTTVNLSEKQAEDIAMKNARTHTWMIGSGNQTFVINNFNVTKPIVKELMFCEAGNASNARDSDQLALYPMLRVGVGLDKYYPGNVYGIYVDIWADTGQVRGIHEVFSTLPPPAGAEVATLAESSIPTMDNQAPASETTSNMFPAVWMVLAAFAVFTVGAVSVWLNRKKTLSSLRLPKLGKIGGAVLCILIGLVVFISLASAVQTVNAACAVIWGETSNGGEAPGGGEYLYHTIQEITLQLAISQQIDSWFGSSGYAHHNYVPASQTTKSNVLYYTDYYGGCYPSVETVYFDHGVGMRGGNYISYPYDREWHYMLCTTYSVKNIPTEDVFDYQLFSATSTGNHYFSYISACHSASLYNGDWFSGYYQGGCTGTYGANYGGFGIIGMPYAWTHGASLSTNGFSDPDTGPYCYIGFVEGSASLCQDVDNRQSGTTIYYTFVFHFFDGLLNNDLTVNQALDYAAYQAFPPEAFAGTALYQGFTAYWPGYGGDDGRMVVYGNGDIYLYAGGPDYVTTPSISGPTSGYINTPYQFSASATDPYGYQLWYTFNWGDGSDPTVTNYPIGVSHTWTSAGPKTITVTAQSQNGITSAPRYHSIAINNPQPVYHTLTVAACCAYGGHPLHPHVYIDDIDYGAAPVSIQVTEGYHSVSLDDYTWDPIWNCYTSFYAMLNYYTGAYYYNGQSIPIYSDTWILAGYLAW